MSDKHNPIPSAEGTSFPVWFIAKRTRDGMVWLAGPWFSRQPAELYLDNYGHRFPRTAIVWCASGHESHHYRHLCETGTLPPMEKP